MSSEPDTAPSLSATALFNVDGFVTLVNGGGTGIGLMMMTKALVQNGARRVYIAGRRLETLQVAADSLGANVIPIECDVTSQKSLQSAASFIEADIGYLILLVCNAGAGGPQNKPIEDATTLKQWADQNLAHDGSRYTDTFTSNSASVWYTSMAFLELLDKGNKTRNLRQSSQIIITTSTSGLYKKPPAGFAYSQSKAAAILAAKQLAIVLPKWNIRANAICPGLFPSNMSTSIVSSNTNAAGVLGELPAEMVPLRRMGDEQDMAGAILHLSSRAGAYCNGASLTVDGGRLGNFPSTG